VQPRLVAATVPLPDISISQHNGVWVASWEEGWGGVAVAGLAVDDPTLDVGLLRLWGVLL
jgi:hypothetical protein